MNDQDKSNLKRKILTAGIQKHQLVIEDFRQRIKEMMETDGNVNEEEYDSNVQSQKSETTDKVSLLSDQLRFTDLELGELNNVKSSIDRIHAVVEFGTVVITDTIAFFVSASIEQFSINGKPIFGLSVKSPLYASMKGKRVGDFFKYGTTTYRIEEIF